MGYTTWGAHKEPYARQSSSGNNNIPLMDNVNSYRSIVIDALGLEFNQHADGFDEMGFEYEQPNIEATKFYDLLNDADERLREGCKKYTKLSAVSRFLNYKSEFNMSESYYDRILFIVKNMLP